MCVCVCVCDLSLSPSLSRFIHTNPLPAPSHYPLTGMLQSQSSREKASLSEILDKLEANQVARHGRTSVASNVAAAIAE